MKNKNLFIILAILILAVLLVTLGFYFQYLAEKGFAVSFELVVIIINIVIFITVMVLFFILRKLYLLEKQEKLLKIQDVYIKHLQELVQVTKSQRHDFVNHLQVVYALLKMNKTDRALRYIETLYHDVRITGKILQISIPELSALLLVKMGIASLKSISFTIIVKSNLKMLQKKTFELNTVIGNLLNNAFEAVESLSVNKRAVTLTIFETKKYCVFQTINPGFIEKELRNKIFEDNFSTKSEGRGTGLASVKSVVEKNKGKIIVSSNKDHEEIKFTAIFPKNQRS
jgi:two-component system sensor histidine kinase AgrC